MNHGQNNFLRRWLMLISLALASCLPATAEDQTVSESQLKSAFLYNFTKFVEWPNAASEATNAPFTIGVVGDDVFGRRLDEVVRSETVHGHPIVVQRIKRGDSGSDCQILFISRSENGNLESLLKSVAGRPVLTVAETEGSAVRGVMVNLLVLKGSLKMEINRAEAQRAQLEIRSDLLKLAKIVTTAK